MIETAEEFVRLRTSESPADYLRAASDTAPIKVWLALIQDYPAMRTWVAHNKTVPAEVLFLLARDPDPSVRYCVAMKNKLPLALFELLANDADPSVRQRIAYNKNAPTDILNHLLQDSSPLVAENARSRLAERGRGRSGAKTGRP